MSPKSQGDGQIHNELSGVSARWVILLVFGSQDIYSGRLIEVRLITEPAGKQCVILQAA